MPWQDSVEAALKCMIPEGITDHERTRVMLDLSKAASAALRESGPLAGTSYILRTDNGGTGFNAMTVGMVLAKFVAYGGSPADATAWLPRVLDVQRGDGFGIAAVRGIEFETTTTLSPGIDAVPQAEWSGQDLLLPEWGAGGLEPRLTLLRIRKTIEPVFVQSEGARLHTSAESQTILRDVRLVLTLLATRYTETDAYWFEFDNKDLQRAELGRTRSVPGSEFREMFQPEPTLLSAPSAVELIEKFFHLDTKLRERIRLSLVRYNRGLREPAWADRALDLAIALESLLLDKAPGDNTFKLALRSALFLGGDLEQRKSTRAIVKGLYGIRSKIVHSGAAPDAEREPIVTDATEIVRQVLHKAIIMGLPKDWNEVELFGG